MNKHLLKYPEVHDYILFHELKHDTTRMKFTWYDFLHDLKSLKPNRYTIQLDKIVFMHPSMWLQFLPLYYSPITKEFYFDVNAFILNTIFIVFLLFTILKVYFSIWG